MGAAASDTRRAADRGPWPRAGAPRWSRRTPACCRSKSRRMPAS